MSDELDNLISEVETELASVSADEKQTGEQAQPKKVDFSVALKEKNKKIQDLKLKLGTLEKQVTEQGKAGEDTTASSNKLAELDTKIKELEEYKTNQEEGLKKTERQKQVQDIRDTLEGLKEKYKSNEDFPFDETKVLSNLYKKTGGYINDLSQIKGEYLSMWKEFELNKNQTEQEKREAQTESPSGVGGHPEIEPKNIEEAFEWLRKTKPK